MAAIVRDLESLDTEGFGLADIARVLKGRQTAEACRLLAVELLDARGGGTWQTLTADLDALHGAGVTLADIAQAVRDDLGEA